MKVLQTKGGDNMTNDKKGEWLRAVSWFGLAMMVLAGIASSNFTSYLTQIGFLVFIILHAYGKIRVRIPVFIGSTLVLFVRLIGYEGAYDLIDMALWSAIMYLVF